MGYTVITRVPDGKKMGNLAITLDTVIEVEQPSESNGWNGVYQSVVEQFGMAALSLRAPVFRLGEVIQLDANDRDQFTRKPSKWDVETETFDDAVEAFARARQVIEEAGL